MANETTYNSGRFFFWFDKTQKLVKIFDRKYHKDYFRENIAFETVFDVAISELDVESCKALAANIVEEDLKEKINEAIQKITEE